MYDQNMFFGIWVSSQCFRSRTDKNRFIMDNVNIGKERTAAYSHYSKISGGDRCQVRGELNVCLERVLARQSRTMMTIAIADSCFRW